MVKATLMNALDWRRKKGEDSGRYSWRVHGTWYVVQYGPGFSNTFLVTEYDEAGLSFLEEIEKKELTSGQDAAVQP